MELSVFPPFFVVFFVFIYFEILQFWHLRGLPDDTGHDLWFSAHFIVFYLPVVDYLTPSLSWCTYKFIFDSDSSTLLASRRLSQIDFVFLSQNTELPRVKKRFPDTTRCTTPSELDQPAPNQEPTFYRLIWHLWSNQVTVMDIDKRNRAFTRRDHRIIPVFPFLLSTLSPPLPLSLSTLPPLFSFSLSPSFSYPPPPPLWPVKTFFDCVNYDQFLHSSLLENVALYWKLQTKPPPHPFPSPPSSKGLSSQSIYKFYLLFFHTLSVSLAILSLSLILWYRPLV